MTQVLSLVSREYAVLVADRRLTDAFTGALFDDDTNKVVEYTKTLLFGYTGLARIGGEQTDYWLLDVLTGKPDVTAALGAVREQATRAFAAVKLPPRLRRHAFVAPGFARFEGASQVLTPAVFHVSNYQADDGNWLAEARDDFRTRVRPLEPGRDWFLGIAGQSIGVNRRVRLRRSIEQARNRSRTDPRLIARLLGEAIRETAKFNDTVGTGLLVSMLPVSAVETDPLRISGMIVPLAGQGMPPYFNVPLDEDAATHVYVPPAKDDAISYGPCIATPDLAVRGMEFGPASEVNLGEK
jgi:hypothetical protein